MAWRGLSGEMERESERESEGEVLVVVVINQRVEPGFVCAEHVDAAFPFWAERTKYLVGSIWPWGLHLLTLL